MVDKSKSLNYEYYNQQNTLKLIYRPYFAKLSLRASHVIIPGTLPIIGVGGISNGQDAYDKIKAGASLVQFYTALIYHGPPVVKKIKQELAELIRFVVMKMLMW